MNAAEMPVRPGDVLAGKYRVESVLGAGGMGVVVAVTHLELLEPRAIKFMRAEGLADADAVERFAREARAASLLKSEHVARVYDVGRLPDGAPYMVMEYLEGADLAAALKRAGAMPVAEAALYILQAAEVLAEAHGRGIVHRDLKPANLFLTLRPDGAPSIKVLDFGISKILGNPAELDITRTDTLLGSPNYMSPEQMLATRDVDGRSDLWSLGVILYQLLTRQLPFRGRTVAEIVAAVLETRPAAPSQLCPGLPPEIDPVVLRCLERDVSLRFADMGELARALAPFAPGSEPLVASIARLAAAPARSSAGLPVAVLSESQRLALTPRGSPAPVERAGAPLALGATPTVTDASHVTPLAARPPLAREVTGAWGGTSAGSMLPRSRVVPAIAAVVAMAVGGLLALGVSLGRSTLSPAPGLASPSASATVAEPPAPRPTVAVGVAAPPSDTASVGMAASASPAASASARGRRSSAPHADPFGMERK